MQAVRRRFLAILTALLLVATTLVAAAAPVSGQIGGSVFINEVHYDNAGGDVGEEIEIAGPAGTDLSGWSIVLYNGTNGTSYGTIVLSGVIADQQGGFGTISFAQAGIQNGGPDGIALVDDTSTVVEFLSYEGSFTATNGVANGLTSTDIGVSESSGTAVGDSLQRAGTGSTAADFIFATEQPNTFGAVNTGQTFGAGGTGSVFINEIHYDNTGADSGEAIEIAGPAGTDLTDWFITLYNGANGEPYAGIALSGVIPDQQGGFGTLSFTHAGIQNGSPDGIALVDDTFTLVEFLSYEGSFEAVASHATGITSTDIGVSEPDSTPVGDSLQRTGTGSTAADFTFAASQPNTFGAINTGQVFQTGGAGELVISEIMYNPASDEDDNEWVELANTGTAAVNLAGYVVDDINGLSHGSANIASGSVPAGGSAVLYNADDLTATDFTTNWGPGINLVPVTNWGVMALNNGGDTIGIWADFASYSGDHATHANALISLAYDDEPPWPVADNVGSIFLSDLAADASDGANWSLSTDGATTPVFDAYTSNGGSIGSPGPTPPDPVVEIGVCGANATLIHAIQGPGTDSPLVGETHVIEGVVVGSFQGTGLLRGFFVQEEDADADADAATSEGIFIFDSTTATSVSIGDQVRVLGDVSEFSGLTEITLDELLVCSSGNAVPGPTSIVLPVAPGTTFENVEGMNVLFPGDLVVTETFSGFEFGEIALAPTVLPNPTEVAAPGAPANAQNDLNDRSRILIDDGSTTRNRECVDTGIDLDPGGFLSSAPQTTRIGDSVTDLTGVMNFSFGNFKVEPTSGDPCAPDFFTRTTSSARPTGPPAVAGSLKVASFNVLNYFLTIDDGVNNARGADSAFEFDRQKAKIVDAINDLDADIVGLIELENDAASAPLADLAAATGMSFVNTGAIGTDAITVAFLYDSTTVAPIGASAVLDSSVDPTFLDTKNRPALLQTFEEIATGERLNVTVNHFKSKGSACTDVGDPDLGDEQGNCNKTRTDAAVALANWLSNDPTGNSDPDNLIIGDLNAYSMEDPIVALESAGYSDLVETLGGNAPSFIFQGEVGRLDHALANDDLAGQVTGAAVWAINMEEPRYLDYNDDTLDAGENQFTSSGDPNPVPLFVADEFRSSDHNPVIIGLDLTAPIPTCNGLPATIVGTPGNDRITGTNGDDVIVSLGGNDRVFGRLGNDIICLGDGNDTGYGHAGEDMIFGEDGNDRLHGHGDDDMLDGGDGVDMLFGHNGEDILIGGDGNDRLTGGPDDDVAHGGDGADKIYGQNGVDTLNGDDGNDLVNGGNGDDIMTGGADDDRLYGANGDDQIEGNDGDDRLFGGNHDDTMDGGADDDLINGAAGIDTCTNGETVSNCEL